MAKLRQSQYTPDFGKALKGTNKMPLCVQRGPKHTSFRGESEAQEMLHGEGTPGSGHEGFFQ